MTIGDPPAPPEGKLIRSARERAIPKLSIRAAAARIGISPEHWGNVERGYKSVKADATPHRVEASPELLAKMAEATGVTPEQMETEGQRPDAAELIRPAAPPPRRLPAAVNSAREVGIDPDNPYDPWLLAVREQVEAARSVHGDDADGTEIFFGTPAASYEAALWNDRRLDEESRIIGIAIIRAYRARDEASRQGNGRSGRAGLVPALTLARR